MILVAAWPSPDCFCVNVVTRDDEKQQFVEAHLSLESVAELMDELKAKGTPATKGYLERLEPIFYAQAKARQLRHALGMMGQLFGRE